MALLKVNTGIGTTNPTSALHVIGDGRFTGVVTAVSFSGNASSATYATSAGIATYATSSGIATYATSSGIATYATSSGIATYATSAGIATYASNAGIATYASNAGIATYASNAGIATYASNAGIATYASNAGIATYADSAGIATYATTAGITTYATTAGVSTSVSGGTGSLTQLQVTGISTFTNGPVLIGSGTSTGTASQPLQVTGGAYVSGNLGIGTTNPSQSLHIQGSSRVTGARYDSSNSAGTSGQILQSTGSGTQWTNAAPANAITGLTIRDEGTIVGTASSFSQLNFVGNIVSVAGTGPSGIATITFLDYVSNAGIATYATSSGIATYATSAGIATYATSVGIATYATSSGIATYATSAGIATYATSAGIATYATSSGIATYAVTAGVSTYATSAGIATYASNAGISTYATTAGIATYATTAGIATYATTAGVSTSVSGGTGSLTQLQVTGISTFTNGPVFIGSGTSTGTVSQRLQVTGGAYVSGNVGIGTTNPSQSLHVQGNARVTGAIYDSTNSPGTSGQILQSTASGTQWTNAAPANAITGLTIRDEGTLVSTANSFSQLNFVGNIVSVAGTGPSGIATITFLDYVSNAGIATYATSSGIATYATTAGIATALQNVRNFSITGNFVTATAISFDGTGNVALAATITPDSIGLGTYTTGDYVKNISGTANQITVTGGTGEGSTPTLSIPSQFTAPQDVTVTRDLQVNRNLNVNGNITIGGTTAFVNVQQLQVADPDLVLGVRTDGSGNDASNDTTANHGGIAIASTEGSPLVSLYNPGIGESTLPTYKKIMWFKSGSFTGLNTDAWLINYAVGIGSTQFPSGTRLAAGNVQFTQSDLAVVRNINASGIITGTLANTLTLNTSGTGLSGSATYNNSGAATFTVASNATSNNTPSTIVARDASGNFSAGTITANLTGTASTASFATTAFNLNDAANITTGTINSARLSGTYNISISNNAATATYATSSGIATYATTAGIATNATYATSSGIATYATTSGVSTNVIGGNASITQLSVSGVSTFSNNIIQTSGSVGLGTTNPLQRLQIGTANTLGVNTTGTVFVVTSNADVGIGTTNPTSKLTVVGDTSISGLTTTNNLYVAGVGTFLSSGLKIRNPANTFGYTITGGAIAADRTLNLPVITGTDTVAVLGLNQTFSGNQSFDAITATGQVTLTTTGTSTLTLGASLQTGTMTLGQSTVSQTTNIQAGASGVGTTKTINFGTNGLSGSFTQINIGPGPSAGVGTVAINAGTNLGIGSVTPTAALDVIGGAKFTGVVTATSFSGNASSATYATNAGIATYATNAGVSTYATSSGIATFATTAGVSTSVSGGTGSLTQLQVTGISTFTNGPVLIGSGTSTGTASQTLQVTGGAYVSGNVGVGTTNPQAQLHITGQFQSTQANSTTTGGGQIYLNGATGNRIDFNTNGVAAPTFTTRSAGTKIVLYPSVNASLVDYALGIDNSTLWSSVRDSTAQFKWYAGITTVATLFGTGELVLGTTTSTGTASQRLQVTGGAYVSGNIGAAVTSPSFAVDVSGDARVQSTGKMRFGGTAGTTNFYIQYNSTTNSLDFVAG